MRLVFACAVWFGFCGRFVSAESVSTASGQGDGPPSQEKKKILDSFRIPSRPPAGEPVWEKLVEGAAKPFSGVTKLGQAPTPIQSDTALHQKETADEEVHHANANDLRARGLRAFDPLFPDGPLLGPVTDPKKDDTQERLPFGDGPGFFPPYLEGTREFWEGNGEAAEKIWETLACPVINPTEFLLTPARCFTGDVPEGPSLRQFFQPAFNNDLMETLTTELLEDVVAPIAARFIFRTLLGVEFFNFILEPLCQVADFFSLLPNDPCDDFECPESMGAPSPKLLCFPGKPAGDECNAHLSSEECGEDDPDKQMECFECARDGTTCPDDCIVCYNPATPQLERGFCIVANCIPDMDNAGRRDRDLNTVDNFDFITSSEATKSTEKPEARAGGDRKRKLGDHGMGVDGQAEDIISLIIETMEDDGILEAQLLDQMKPALLDPELINRVKDRLTESFVVDGQMPITETSARILSALEDDNGDPNHNSSSSGKKTRRRLGFVADNARCCPEEDHDICDNFIDLILPVDDIIGVIEKVIVSVIGEIVSVFSAVNGAAGEFTGSFGFVLPFLKILDPWIPDSIVGSLNRNIINIFQSALASYVYDCDVSDTDCIDANIPTRKGTAITITPTRDATGPVYSAGGCDPEFYAELLWYGPVFSVVDSLLENAKDTVLEFVNLPITFVRFCLASAQRTFEHMKNTCDFLGDWVQASQVEAAFENSRLILQEVMCRPPDKPLRGHGCDGIDQDCDCEVDECDEDQIPPEIVLEAKVPIAPFQSMNDAIEFLDCNVHVSDDCATSLETKIYVEDMDCTECTFVVNVTDPRCDHNAASAQAKFVLVVDSTPPVITCGFFTPQDPLHVLGGEFDPCEGLSPPYPEEDDILHIDNSYLHKEITDVALWYQISMAGFGDDAIDVQIRVLSNELDDKRMTRIAERNDLPGAVHRIELYLAPFSCQDDNGNQSPICKEEKTVTTRVYDIEIKATDTAGNEGMKTCSVIIVPEDHYARPGGKSGKSGRALITAKLYEDEDGDSSSKSKKSVKYHDPHNEDDLRIEYTKSIQRFVIDTFSLQWDPMLDTTLNVPPLPALKTKTSGKSGKHGGSGDYGTDLYDIDALCEGKGKGKGGQGKSDKIKGTHDTSTSPTPPPSTSSRPSFQP